MPTWCRDRQTNGKLSTMIHWMFKCLRCGYNFRAITPQTDYDAYTDCAMCGSKEFDKSIRKCNGFL